MEQNSSYGVSSGGVLGGGVTGGSVSGGGTTVSTEPVSQTPPADEDPPASVKPSAPNPDNKPKPKPSEDTTEPDGQGEPAADDGGEGSPTDDSEPRIPDITEDDGSGSGEWCGNDEDTTTGKGDFFDENKELIKKLKYVLEFVYPDSGIDLAKLLTGGKGYIAMLAGGPGGVSGQGETEGDGSGQGEIAGGGFGSQDETNYSIYVDDSKEPIEEGVYEANDSKEFFIEKSMEYLWKNDDLFTEKNVEISGDNVIIKRKIKIVFKGKKVTTKLSDSVFSQKLSTAKAIYHNIFCDAKVGAFSGNDYKESGKVVKQIYECEFTGTHSREAVKSVGISEISSKAIAAYLNEIYAKTETEINKLISYYSQRMNKPNMKKGVFNKLKQAEYDFEAYENDYRFTNNIQSLFGIGHSQCIGFSSAFYVIMKKLGASPSIGIVFSDNQDHTWNYEIDKNGKGSWYDVTFASCDTGQNYYAFKNDVLEPDLDIDFNDNDSEEKKRERINQEVSTWEIYDVDLNRVTINYDSFNGTTAKLGPTLNL